MSFFDCLSQVKIWFQNRRMKWRNTKERELLAAGTGCREQTLPTKNNPNPDLSDVTTFTSNNNNNNNSMASSTVMTPHQIGTSTSTPTIQQECKKKKNDTKNHMHVVQQKQQLHQKKINVAVDQMLLNRGTGGPHPNRQQQVL